MKKHKILFSFIFSFISIYPFAQSSGYYSCEELSKVDQERLTWSAKRNIYRLQDLLNRLTKQNQSTNQKTETKKHIIKRLFYNDAQTVIDSAFENGNEISISRYLDLIATSSIQRIIWQGPVSMGKECNIDTCFKVAEDRNKDNVTYTSIKEIKIKAVPKQIKKGKSEAFKFDMRLSLITTRNFKRRKY